MQLFSNSSNMVSNSRSIIVIRCSKQNHIRFFCRCHNRIQLFITAINFGIADSKCWGKSFSSSAQQLQSWTNCRKQSIPAVQRYPWTEQTCHSALPVQAVFLLSGIRSKIWQQTFPPQVAEDIVFIVQFLLFIANLRISSTILLMATGLSTMNSPRKTPVFPLFLSALELLLLTAKNRADSSSRMLTKLFIW